MRHVTLFALLAFLPVHGFSQAGSLDPDFGTNGKVMMPTIGPGANDQAVTAVVLPDGRFVVAGRSNNGTFFNSVLLRFNANGSLDQTFGSGGLVEHDLASGSEFIRSCVLDAQGRLVVGGHFFSDAAETNSDMFVARFLPDGSLDPTFNGIGLVIRDLHTTPDAEEAYEVLVQPDGKIVLCGFSGPSEEFTEVVVERFMVDGSVDPTFGGDGSVLVYIGNATGEQLRGAVLGDDGGIYFCGFAYATGETEQSLLLGHVDANGNSPSTFGNANGHSLVSVAGTDVLGRAIAALPNGGFSVAGVERTAGASQARMIFTFDATGNMAFNSIYDDPAGGDAWNALLVQNNGSIISGGNVADGPGFRNWNVERQFANLDIDPSFDAVDYDEGDGLETCFDLEFFGDSSILGIGTAELSGGATYIVLLKYVNDISSSINNDDPVSWATVFPNPVADRTMLTFAPGSTRMASLSLMDAQGRTVSGWSHSLSGNGTLELDLSGLVPGVYGLRRNSLDPQAVLKIVKQ